MYFDLCPQKRMFDVNQFFTKCFFGAFSSSAVKLVLELPWDSGILDNVMAVRGEVQVP